MQKGPNKLLDELEALIGAGLGQQRYNAKTKEFLDGYVNALNEQFEKFSNDPSSDKLDSLRKALETCQNNRIGSLKYSSIKEKLDEITPSINGSSKRNKLR